MRGKKLALRTSSLVTYAVLRTDAEEKWKKFHSNLSCGDESYHLLYKDGTQALFLPGSQNEPFTLKCYQQETEKDFKRIKFFLCTDHDVKKSQGQCESSDSSEDPGFEKITTPVAMSHCSRYNGLHVETVYNKEEIRSQLDLDQQIASELQELYNSEVDGDVCIPSECLEDNELNAGSILKE